MSCISQLRAKDADLARRVAASIRNMEGENTPQSKALEVANMLVSEYEGVEEAALSDVWEQFTKRHPKKAQAIEKEEVSASQKEAPVEPKVEPPVEPKVEAPVEPKVEPPVEPKVEAPVEPKVEPPVEPKVEAPVEPKVEPPVEPKVEPPVEPKVEAPNANTQAYSKPKGIPGGLKVSQILNRLSKKQKALLENGNLELVNTTSELPADVLGTEDKASVNFVAEGLYKGDKDKIYIVADGVTEQTLPKVLAHEAFHRALATDKKLQAAYEKFKGNIENRFNLARDGKGSKTELTAYQRVLDSEVGKEGDFTLEQIRKAELEEFMAYMITEYVNRPESFSQSVQRAIRDFLAAIKVALVRAGVPVEIMRDLTPADFAAMSRYGWNLTSETRVGQSPKTANYRQRLEAMKSVPKKDVDTAYLDAVNKGDMETAQRIVDEAAEAAGYGKSDYQMQHQAPDRESGYPINDLTQIYPDDIYSGEAVQYYGDGQSQDYEAIRKLQAARDKKPTQTFHVFRAVPKTLKETTPRNGDWVSTTRGYAEQHGKNYLTEGYKVISYPAMIKNVFTDGNSIHELGYDDGKNYAYANTKNNRKLLDPVTRDDNGDVIPLSQRFNKRKDDIRFSKPAKVSEFAREVKEDLGLKAFYVTESKGDLILDSIIVPKEAQKKGLGSQAMQKLVDYADAHSKRIILTPGLPNDNHGTTSRKRLVEFYKRFGFKENKGRSLDFEIGAGKMFRESKKPEVSKFSKPTRVSFYSELQRSVANDKIPKAAYQSAKNLKQWLSNPGNLGKIGVKADEVYWSGLNDWLDLRGKGVVNKDEVNTFLLGNGVATKDVVLGEDNKRYTMEKTKEKSEFGYYWNVVDSEDNSIKIPRLTRDNAEQRMEILNSNLGLSPKYENSEYVVPGGKDAKEIIVEVPTSEDFNTDEAHYGNISKKQVAWVRLDSRSDAEGNDGTFINEIQSKRSMEGRKEGFAGDRKKFDAIREKMKVFEDKIDKSNIDEVDSLNSIPEYKALADQAKKINPAYGIPPAPFVTDRNNKPSDAYIALMLKKAVASAIEAGHGWVAWTRGDQQADFYKLSKKIDHIDYRKDENGNFELGVVDKDGQEVDLPKESYAPDELDDLIGKDVAQKIRNGEGKVGGGRTTLRGIALDINPKWVTDVYGDENGNNKKGEASLIKQAAIDIARKMGGEVGSVDVDTAQDNSGWRVEYPDGSLGSMRFVSKERAQVVADAKEGKVVSFKNPSKNPALIITPAMAEKVGREGMPLFSKPKKGTAHADKLRAWGAEVVGDTVILYRGGNVDKNVLKQLRYNDYLSAVKNGKDSTGNEGASSYGKNVVKFELNINDVDVSGTGEFQYKGDSQSISKGLKYPSKIYKAYNDAYGSNYTSTEIDNQDNVRSVASQALSGGREEFDELLKKHGGVTPLFSKPKKTSDTTIYWHGSASGDLRGGSTGLHLGTKLAATQALEARIGVPAEGEWDGTREYGKTKLAGKQTLKRLEKERGYFLKTGLNAGERDKPIPEEDYYPWKVLEYPDGSTMHMSVKPSVKPYQLNTEMSNEKYQPHEDFKANGYMSAQLKKGTAKRGYYYSNIAEDSGTVSVVVPNGSHVTPVVEGPLFSKPSLQGVKDYFTQEDRTVNTLADMRKVLGTGRMPQDVTTWQSFKDKMTKILIDSSRPFDAWTRMFPDQAAAGQMILSKDRAKRMTAVMEQEALQKFLTPAADQISKIAKKNDWDYRAVKDMVGFWMSQRYAIEKNQDFIRQDTDAANAAYNAMMADPGNAALAKAATKAYKKMHERIAAVNEQREVDPTDEKLAAGLAGGYNDFTAKKMMAEIEAKIPRATLEKAAKPIYDMMQWKVQRDIANGKVTQQQVSQWFNSPYYVPLTGDPSVDTSEETLFNHGSVNQGKDKRALGRAGSISQNGIDAAVEQVQKSARYHGWKDFKDNLVDMYDSLFAEEKFADPSLTDAEIESAIMKKYKISVRQEGGTTPVSDTSIIVRKPGVAHRWGENRIYDLHNAEAVDALKSVNKEEVPSSLQHIAYFTRQYARAVTQLLPGFAVVNMTRDTWERSENIRTRILPGYETLDMDKIGRKAIANAANPRLVRKIAGVLAENTAFARKFPVNNNDPDVALLRRMIASGGTSTVGDYLGATGKDLAKQMADRLGWSRNIMDAVSVWNNSFELISSFSIFKALTEAGVDDKTASGGVLNMMNFGKQGTAIGPIKALYTFVNPTMQGGHQMIQTLSTKRGKQRAAAYLVSGIALYTMLAAMAGDDDELGKNKLMSQSNFIAERNIQIPFGDEFIRIPMGFGMPQAMWAAAVNIVKAMSGDQSVGESAVEILKGWSRTLAPVAPSETSIADHPIVWLAQTFTPQIGKPLMNVGLDVSMFGGSLTNAKFYKENVSESLQGRKSTAEFWKVIAQDLAQMGIHTYPEVVKEIVRGYAVGPLNEILKAWVENPNKEQLGRKSVHWAVDRFVSTYDSGSLKERLYYRYRDEMNQAGKRASLGKELSPREQGLVSLLDNVKKLEGRANGKLSSATKAEKAGNKEAAANYRKLGDDIRENTKAIVFRQMKKLNED